MCYSYPELFVLLVKQTNKRQSFTAQPTLFGGEGGILRYISVNTFFKVTVLFLWSSLKIKVDRWRILKVTWEYSRGASIHNRCERENVAKTQEKRITLDCVKSLLQRVISQRTTSVALILRNHPGVETSRVSAHFMVSAHFIVSAHNTHIAKYNLEVMHSN